MGSRRTHERRGGRRRPGRLHRRLRHHLEPRGAVRLRRAVGRHLGTRLHAGARQREDAFAAQLPLLGAGTTLLVDTYDVEPGGRAAVEAAGAALGAVRIDCGDLGARRSGPALLDSLGASATRIVLSGDLDEYSIAGLAGAPVDGYGVGTWLVTGSGAPTAAMIYKLVARSDTPLADGKPPAGRAAAGGQAVGGQAGARRAQVGRARADRRGEAVTERIWLAPPSSRRRPTASLLQRARPRREDHRARAARGRAGAAAWCSPTALLRAAAISRLPRDPHRLRPRPRGRLTERPNLSRQSQNPSSPRTDGGFAWHGPPLGFLPRDSQPLETHKQSRATTNQRPQPIRGLFGPPVPATANSGVIGRLRLRLCDATGLPGRTRRSPGGNGAAGRTSAHRQARRTRKRCSSRQC